MNARHAVALVFWMIMAPPIRAGKPNASAPLIDWHVFTHLYPSKEACESMRSRVLQFASNEQNNPAIKGCVGIPVTPATMGATFDSMKGAVCVSSTDSQIKEK
jgi:hypothetical protein